MTKPIRFCHRRKRPFLAMPDSDNCHSRKRSESSIWSADCEFDRVQIMCLQRMSEMRAAVAEFGSIAERQLWAVLAEPVRPRGRKCCDRPDDGFEPISTDVAECLRVCSVLKALAPNPSPSLPMALDGRTTLFQYRSTHSRLSPFRRAPLHATP